MKEIHSYSHDVKQTKIYAGSYADLLTDLSIWIETNKKHLIQSIYIYENGFYSGEGAEMIAIIYWNE